MDPLATTDDLDARLPSGTITDPARAAQLLADVSAAFRRKTGQTFTEATTTERLKVRKNKIRLPQRPVISVASVVDLNAVPITVFTVVNNVVHLDPMVPDPWAWEPRRTALGFVDVTYTHGYNPLPDDLVGLVCQVAGRGYGTLPTESGVSQESLGAYSYTIGSTAAAGPFGLFAGEEAWLEQFADEGGLIYISQ